MKTNAAVNKQGIIPFVPNAQATLNGGSQAETSVSINTAAIVASNTITSSFSMMF